MQPGPVDTNMNPNGSDFTKQLKALITVNRYGKDEEIASFVAYLAGPEESYITDTSLSINGGFSV